MMSHTKARFSPQTVALYMPQRLPSKGGFSDIGVGNILRHANTVNPALLQEGMAGVTGTDPGTCTRASYASCPCSQLTRTQAHHAALVVIRHRWG